jgi:hypothetical protein
MCRAAGPHVAGPQGCADNTRGEWEQQHASHSHVHLTCTPSASYRVSQGWAAHDGQSRAADTSTNFKQPVMSLTVMGRSTPAPPLPPKHDSATPACGSTHPHMPQPGSAQPAPASPRSGVPPCRAAHATSTTLRSRPWHQRNSPAATAQHSPSWSRGGAPCPAPAGRGRPACRGAGTPSGAAAGA